MEDPTDGPLRLDAASVDEVYRRVFPMITRKCIRMLGDSAEAQDVAQETFMRFWSARGGIAEPAAALGWLYRTATRIAIDRLRVSRRDQPLDDVHASRLPEGGSLEEQSASRALLIQVAALVPADELEAGILSRVDGLTQPEAAEVMGISERTVRRLLTKLEDRLTRMRTRHEAEA